MVIKRSTFFQTFYKNNFQEFVSYGQPFSMTLNFLRYYVTIKFAHITISSKSKYFIDDFELALYF